MIATGALNSVEIFADKDGIRKEEISQKMIVEACILKGWDMYEFSKACIFLLSLLVN